MSRPDQISAGTGEQRCVCGSLLARLNADGVELKCRRCKRVVVIPWCAGTRWHGVSVTWDPQGGSTT